MMVRWLPLLAVCAGCTAGIDRDPALPPLPAFEDDCTEAVNDTLEDAVGLDSEHDTAVDASLCDRETDWYRIDVPPGKWLAVDLVIDGSGKGASDLDLIETTLDGQDLWASATEQAFERLAWYNPSFVPRTRRFRIEGYRDAAADYTLVVRTSEFHDGVLDCDTAYPDADPRDEDGPCNAIMAFPRSERYDDGYFVEHPPHYSHLRREVIYLVRYAVRETYEAFPDTKPLATLDMSEFDGSTPGTMVGQPRHPAGTHVDGNDIDIAYYQTGDDNAGRPVCQNNGYFCTQKPHLLDAPRTAFFLAKLFESPNVRVIGVDPEIGKMVEREAWNLVEEGLLSSDDAHTINSYSLAYGDGWPFHHHHLHFSWNWEDGYQYRAPIPDGCMVGPDLDPQPADAESEQL